MEQLKKTPTGINGLDEILVGGLPFGRPTLLSGGPGCGKTALAMEFVCRGARQFNEPGLFVSFEETPEDLRLNFASSAFGFSDALAQRSVSIVSFLADREASAQTGEFNLVGLLVRLENSLNKAGARRLVLDSLNALLSRFSDDANLRYEISRIFHWIKEKEITTIVTNEREEREFNRFGLDEYITDCVIHMDHRVAQQISKRRLRVVKYRGSTHGADEYPFLILGDGLSILPITSLGLDSDAPKDFISTGIEGLDAMLAGKGYYRGSTVLISGGAGTGKSTVAACIAKNLCSKGGRSLYLSFEESSSQIVRNMRSVGIDLEGHIKNGLMRIEPIRPGRFGLEEHLVRVHAIIKDFKPETVVLDPITSFVSLGDTLEVRAMLARLLDFLKGKGISSILTSLTPGTGSDEETETAVSSMVDTWIIIRFLRTDRDCQRQIWVHKARGIGHSHSICQLILSGSGPAVNIGFDAAEAAGGEE
jgi:circadian clock protein KaiC